MTPTFLATYSDGTPVTPPDAATDRTAQIVRLRMILSLWDEADLEALLAYRRAAHGPDERAAMRALIDIGSARESIRNAYAGAVTGLYPRPVASHLQSEIDCARTGAADPDVVSEEDRARRQHHLCWIEAVIGDALARLSGERRDADPLPVPEPR